MENDRHVLEPQLFGQQHHVLAIELDIEDRRVGRFLAKRFKRIRNVFVWPHDGKPMVLERVLEVEGDDIFILDNQDCCGDPALLVGGSLSDSR